MLIISIEIFFFSKLIRSLSEIFQIKRKDTMGLTPNYEDVECRLRLNRYHMRIMNGIPLCVRDGTSSVFPYRYR